jgi:hypothetical protein
MSAYKNILDFFNSIGYTFDNADEVKNTSPMLHTTRIIFSCQNNHQKTITKCSFTNDLSKYNKAAKKAQTDNDTTPIFFCSDCRTEYKAKETILKLTGHKITTYVNVKKVYYICGNCGTENNESNMAALKKNTGFCIKCLNNKNRITEAELNAMAKKCGSKILTPYSEYRHNEQLLDVECKCGNIRQASAKQLRDGKNCYDCAVKKRDVTNMVKYGVKNPFESETIKQQMRTNYEEKYGVSHHMKRPEVLEKVKSTCSELYGVKYAFMQEWVYEKHRQIFMERFGVPHPLMNKMIRDKCREKCLENHGVNYPLQSEDLRKLCTETLMGNYGVDSPFKSEIIRQRAKETLMNNYGVDYPMRCPEIFHKSMATSFRKKEYILPRSLKIVQLMGYEPYALDFLLNNGLFGSRIDECDIKLMSDVRIFKYMYDYSECVYYPDMDIHVNDTDVIVEVKSEWTLNRAIDRNIAKFKQVCNDGFRMVLIVMNEKGGLIEICEYGIVDEQLVKVRVDEGK